MMKKEETENKEERKRLPEKKRENNERNGDGLVGRGGRKGGEHEEQPNKTRQEKEGGRAE